MKTLVCFKAVPDLGMLTAGEWEIIGESIDNSHLKNVRGANDPLPGIPLPDIAYIRQMFNCFDESALEMALRLCEPTKKTTPYELTALTVDDSRADLFSTHLLAIGYDRAVRIETNMDLRFNARSVSRLISAYIKKIGRQQLVILGTQGGEGDNRETGPLVAEHLGWPCIREVTNLAVDDASRDITVVSQAVEDRIEQTISLPAVLVVGNSLTSPFLRVPTLKQKLNSRKKKIVVHSIRDLEVTDLQMKSKDKTLLGLKKEKSSRQCTMIDGSSALEKARQLFDHYLKKRICR